MPGLRFRSEEEYAAWKRKLGTVSEEPTTPAQLELRAYYDPRFTRIVSHYSNLGMFWLGFTTMAILIVVGILLLGHAGWLG